MKSEFESYLRSNQKYRGWSFAVGPAEIFYYQDRLVKPGGSVLDLGAEYGRASMFFALNGMHVHAIDLDEESLKIYEEAAAEISEGSDTLPSTPVSVSTEVADVEQIDFGTEQHDVVIMSAFPIHFPNKERALEVTRRAVQSLKPGGHIYFHAVTKADSQYEEWQHARYSPEEPKIINRDVIEVWCGCSGERIREPVLFFDVEDILLTLAEEGCNIVHSQIAPAKPGRGTNVMCGEDDSRGSWGATGFVTVIGQKKERNNACGSDDSHVL